MSNTTKYVVGGVIILGAGILIYETTKKKETVKSPQQKIGETNRQMAQQYSQDQQSKINQKRDKILGPQDPNQNPKDYTQQKLQQVETQQYMLNQFNKQVSADEKSGKMDSGSYFSQPSAQATNQNILDGLNKLPSVFTPITQQMKQDVTTRQANQVAMDQYTTNQQSKIAQQYGKLQAESDRETDPKKKARYDEKINNLTKEQDDLDTMKAKFKSDTESGKNDKGLTPMAQYQRNQKAAQTQKPATNWGSKIQYAVQKQNTIKK